MKRTLFASSLSPEMLANALMIECSYDIPASKAWLMKEYTEQMKEFSMPSWAVKRYCAGVVKVSVKAFVAFGVVMVLVNNCIFSFVAKSVIAIIDTATKKFKQVYYHKVGTSLLPTSNGCFCEAWSGTRRFGGVYQ